MRGNLVSTIIPVYNRPERVGAAIRSVIAQTWRPIEIIVVDDGSTDTTAAVVESLAETCDEVTALHVTNRGAGAARETGRQLANGEFIQYLDSDDLLLPNKFYAQIRALRANPDRDIAYGYMRHVDDSGRVLAAPSQWTGREYRELFPALLVDMWWGTHTPLYRRSLCDRIGPWRAMRRGEDWEYEGRAAALSAKLIQCHEYVCVDVRHDEDRMTAHLDRPAVEDYATLLHSLHQSAERAGVPRDCAEMRHFGRHCFLAARRLGRFGNVGRSKELFELSRRICNNAGLGSWDFLLYKVAASILGWRLAGLTAGTLDAFRPSRLRSATLPTSKHRAHEDPSGGA